MKVAFGLGVLAFVTAATGAQAAAVRFQCICPKPSCAAYGQKKVLFQYDSERPTEATMRYIDTGGAPEAKSEVHLLGARVTRDETETVAYFRELASVDPTTRERRTSGQTTGSYLKVEKLLLEGGDRGRLQWVGEKEQGAFALLYVCGAM